MKLKPCPFCGNTTGNIASCDDAFDEIIMAISAVTPWRGDQVKSAYEACHSYDRTLWACENAHRLNLDPKAALSHARQNEQEQGRCPTCGSEYHTRQDRYTDGEWARSESYGCPNHCDQLSKPTISTESRDSGRPINLEEGES